MNIGYGWCNDIIKSEFSYNNGDGIIFNSGSNNAVNIQNNRIFTNKGIGIFLHEGKQINISVNTIEDNAKTGIYAAGAITGLSISK